MSVSPFRSPQDLQADNLTQLTGGKVRVTFCPDAFQDNAPGDVGHQWSVELTVDASQEIGIDESWLDDRDGAVQPQAAAVVRGWARALEALADRIDCRQPQDHAGEGRDNDV